MKHDSVKSLFRNFN